MPKHSPKRRVGGHLRRLQLNLHKPCSPVVLKWTLNHLERLKPYVGFFENTDVGYSMWLNLEIKRLTEKTEQWSK